jgi:zinc protease
MKRFLLALIIVVFALPAHAAVQVVKSPKGITAWLVEDQTIPIVSVSFAWRFGLEEDPDDRQGLGYLAANMMTQGSGKDDANTFQKKLQDNAISLGFDTSRDAITGSVRSLKETWPLAKDMLKAAVQSPRFDADALARQKAQMVSSLNMYRADSGWLLSRLAYSQIFENHPYGKRTLGTPATIAAITQADLKAWHGRLDRAHLVVAVTGAITPAEVATMLEEVFGNLPAKRDVPAVAEVNYTPAGTISLLQHPGTQSDIMVVWNGMKGNDPDWYVAEVMNYILGGGGFASRLTETIREKRGLTYGISSGIIDYEHAALFVIQGSSKNENAAEVISLVKGEVAKYLKDPVTPEELKEAKDYLIGAYPLQLTSTARVSAHNRELQRDGKPMNEQEKRADAIAKVTVDDVQRVAKRLLEGQPAIFIVGQPTGLEGVKTFTNIE